MTRYVQICVVGPGVGPARLRVKDFDPDGWRPWLNCAPGDDIVRLALHRFVRDRGGVLPDETVSVMVYHCDDKTARHPNGRPVWCRAAHCVLSGRDVPER